MVLKYLLNIKNVVSRSRHVLTHAWEHHLWYDLWMLISFIYPVMILAAQRSAFACATEVRISPYYLSNLTTVLSFQSQASKF
jgi:hypothetical protein